MPDPSAHFSTHYANGADPLDPTLLGTFTESVQDIVGALLVAGANITLTYNDAANTLTIDVSGLTESVQDIVGALGLGGSGLTFTYNDAANTAVIDVNVDGSSIEVSSDALRVKAAGITNAMLAGSITTDKIDTGALSTWTPTVGGTGWALGNGSVVGHYQKIGRVVWVQGKVTFGSTSSSSANQLVIGGLPNSIGSTLVGLMECKLLDSSGSQWYRGFFSGAVSGTSGLIFCDKDAFGVALDNPVTATDPFTWASGDEVHIVGAYEAAS